MRNIFEMVLNELIHAGIPRNMIDIFPKIKRITNCHCRVSIDNFTFERSNNAWHVIGEVPIEIAQSIYENNNLRKAILVLGYWPSSDPEKYKYPSKDDFTDEKYKALKKKSYDEVILLCNLEGINNNFTISSYCIRTQKALDYFIEKLIESELININI